MCSLLDSVYCGSLPCPAVDVPVRIVVVLKNLIKCKYATLHVFIGTAVAQWLMCCATNQNVAGSIPDGVIGIFHSHNPSDRSMALAGVDSTSNRNEYQEDFLGVNAAGA